MSEPSGDTCKDCLYCYEIKDIEGYADHLECRHDPPRTVGDCSFVGYWPWIPKEATRDPWCRRWEAKA